MDFKLARRLLAVAALTTGLAPAAIWAQDLTGTLAKINDSGEIVIGHLSE